MLHPRLVVFVVFVVTSCNLSATVLLPVGCLSLLKITLAVVLSLLTVSIAVGASLLTSVALEVLFEWT